MARHSIAHGALPHMIPRQARGFRQHAHAVAAVVLEPGPYCLPGCFSIFQHFSTFSNTFPTDTAGQRFHFWSVEPWFHHQLVHSSWAPLVGSAGKRSQRPLVWTSPVQPHHRHLQASHTWLLPQFRTVSPNICPNLTSNIAFFRTCQDSWKDCEVQSVAPKPFAPQRAQSLPCLCWAPGAIRTGNGAVHFFSFKLLAFRKTSPFMGSTISWEYLELVQEPPHRFMPSPGFAADMLSGSTVAQLGAAKCRKSCPRPRARPVLMALLHASMARWGDVGQENMWSPFWAGDLSMKQVTKFEGVQLRCLVYFEQFPHQLADHGCQCWKGPKKKDDESWQ